MNIALRFLIFLITLFLSTHTQAAEKKVPILIYHSIAEFTGHGDKELYVTPKSFEEQMTYLRDNGYTLLTFDRWKDIKRVNKPIFITFDDGYKNNLNAFYILQKLKKDQFKPMGTIFVISDFIGRPNRLSTEDLKRLSDSGMISIQSHTATHPDLTTIVNYQYEMKESRDKIQRITGKPVIALSYPYGNYNNNVISETKKYYLFGLTTTPERFTEKNLKDELYLLPRIYIKYSTTMDEFSKIVGKE